MDISDYFKTKYGFKRICKIRCRNETLVVLNNDGLLIGNKERF